MSLPTPKWFVWVSTWGVSWNKRKHTSKQSWPKYGSHTDSSLFDFIPPCKVVWQIFRTSRNLFQETDPLLLLPGLHPFLCTAQNSWGKFQFLETTISKVQLPRATVLKCLFKTFPFLEGQSRFHLKLSWWLTTTHKVRICHSEASWRLRKQFSHNYDFGSRGKIVTWLWKWRSLGSGHQDAIAIWIWRVMRTQ